MSAIYVGERSLKQTSTTSRLIFAHSLLPPPPPLALAPSTPLTSHINTATSPSPPLRDVGSIKIVSAPSQARLQPQPPLLFSKGCGPVSLAQRKIRGGRKTNETQKMSRPEATTLMMGESGGRRGEVTRRRGEMRGRRRNDTTTMRRTDTPPSV